MQTMDCRDRTSLESELPTRLTEKIDRWVLTHLDGEI